MPISWKTSDGNTGIAENDYEFAMQHSNTEAKSDKIIPQTNLSTKGDREELAPQDRINQAFGEGPAAPEIKDQNAPYSWGMGEDLKGLGVQPDAPADEWEKSYGPRRPMHEQLASFQQRLDETPPEEAGAFRKFLGSLNIMPAPGKPESEWTAKEHFGVLLNTAMAGMGGGIKVPPKGVPMTRLYRAETSTLPGEKPASLSEWMKDDPTIEGMLKATGRWFTNSKETAQWYQDKMSGRGISFVDVPTSEVEKHLASNNPEAAKFTAAGRAKEEYFLPPKLAAGRKPLSDVIPPKTVTTPAQEQLAKYEELSSQGKTTKQIVKGTKLAPEQVREALGRDNLAIAAFNSENALTNAYFKSLERLDPALGEALKKQVSIKDLKRYTRGLPEEQLKTIFEDLPSHVKEAFESGEQRRMNIDAGKKAKVIPKPLK